MISYIERGRTVILDIHGEEDRYSTVLPMVIDKGLASKEKIVLATSSGIFHRKAVKYIIRTFEGTDLKVIDLPYGGIECPGINRSDGICPKPTLPCKRSNICNSTGFDINTYREIKNQRKDFKQVQESCLQNGMCPLEISANAALEADVIVCDYRYIFSDPKKELPFRVQTRNAILIVDDSHNLPDKIRYGLRTDLELRGLREAIDMVSDSKERSLVYYLEGIKAVMETLEERFYGDSEVEIERGELLKSIEGLFGKGSSFGLSLDAFIELLVLKSSRMGENSSLLMEVVRFIDILRDPGGPCIVILDCYKETKVLVKYLDPSIISKKVFKNAKASILLSNCHLPKEMYSDLLGIDRKWIAKRARQNSLGAKAFLLDSGFTTKMDQRTPEMYENMAKEISAISRTIPGVLGVFLPSFQILEEISEHMKGCEVEVYKENRNNSIKEKKDILAQLACVKDAKNMVLLAVQGGFFASQRFKGDIFQAAVVIGVPYSRPGIEQQASQEYLKSRFGGMKGYYYSQLYPAVTKVVQSIDLSCKDDERKRVCILMDKRFKDPRVLKALPSRYQVDLERDIPGTLERFYSKDPQDDQGSSGW